MSSFNDMDIKFKPGKDRRPKYRKRKGNIFIVNSSHLIGRGHKAGLW